MSAYNALSDNFTFNISFMDFINLIWNSNQENRINGIEGHVI